MRIFARNLFHYSDMRHLINGLIDLASIQLLRNISSAIPKFLIDRANYQIVLNRSPRKQSLSK